MQALANTQAHLNPRLTELTEALFKEFKGAEGVARFMYEEFDHAAPGSATRERLLQTMVNLVMANQKFKLHDDIDPSVLTDEQLDMFEGELGAG